MGVNIDELIDDLQAGLTKIVDHVIESDPAKIEGELDRLRLQNPNITDNQLARKVVKRASIKNGVLGFATGIPGGIAMPVTIPTDVLVSWRIQGTMAYSVAYIFGYTHDNSDLRTDMYIILAGDGAGEVLRQAGIASAKLITKKVVERYTARKAAEGMVRAFAPIVARQVAVNTGKQVVKRGPSKLIPLIGGPVGAVWSWTQARAIGEFAIKYYSGEI